MYAYVTIIRYPLLLSWAGFLSMAVFRLPLMLNRSFTFYKLMGCGRHGTFSKIPDARQWVIFGVTKNPAGALQGDISAHQFHSRLYGKFISAWTRFFRTQTKTFVLHAVQSHGSWNGKKIFGEPSGKLSSHEKIAVLTRATIRVKKLHRFWQHVAPVSASMTKAPGFIFSLGMGEWPWLRQATFSIWENKEAMQAFAYGMPQHATVVERTRQENWYSEDLFARFIVVKYIDENSA